MSPPAPEDVSNTLSTLKINTSSFAKNKAKAPPVDSWEDDTSSSSPDTPTASSKNTSTTLSPANTGSTAPPPTPASPTAHDSFPSFDHPYANIASTSEASRGSKTRNLDRRPDKTTSTAARLIAGGLGVKVQRTEEQKKYDKAMREQLLLAKKKEKQEAAEKKEAQMAIWEK